MSKGKKPSARVEVPQFNFTETELEKSKDLVKNMDQDELGKLLGDQMQKAIHMADILDKNIGKMVQATHISLPCVMLAIEVLKEIFLSRIPEGLREDVYANAMELKEYVKVGGYSVNTTKTN